MEYSNGNRKIGTDTIIINMGSATSCPSAKLGLCQLSQNRESALSKCYAYKAERMYKNSLYYRNRQEIAWKSKTAQEYIEQIKVVTSKKIKLKYLRFNESGDFFTQDCVNKLSDIARGLKGILKVYTYTARKDLDFSNVDENLAIDGSGFTVHNEFTVVTKATGNIICPGNCRDCHICKTRHNVKVEVINH